MESTWTKADFRNYGKLQGPSGDLLRSTQEVLARELGLSLSAFLRCSVTAVFQDAAEYPFGDLPNDDGQSCLGTALVRPDDRSFLVQLDYSVLYPLIGIALGAKSGSFTTPDRKPTDIAKHLGDRGIFTWDGNYYALNLTERLGVEQKGGLLRIGIVHYNTTEEIDRLLGALRELASS